MTMADETTDQIASTGADTTPSTDGPTISPDLAASTEATVVDRSDGKKLIVVAEDDPFIARMYETKMKMSGYDVTVVNNGRQAFETIKASRPNLAMLDINMPELSGLEVLNALSGDNFDFSATPIFILTNSSNEADRKTAESFGAEYMIKAELTPRDVIERINSKLSGGTAEGAKPDDGGKASG
jgi:DNA-binding response OmpR family regulator